LVPALSASGVPHGACCAPAGRFTRVSAAAGPVAPTPHSHSPGSFARAKTSLKAGGPSRSRTPVHPGERHGRTPGAPACRLDLYPSKNIGQVEDPAIIRAAGSPPLDGVKTCSEFICVFSPAGLLPRLSEPLRRPRLQRFQASSGSSKRLFGSSRWTALEDNSGTATSGVSGSCGPGRIGSPSLHGTLERASDH
jgi:hypothetical protein